MVFNIAMDPFQYDITNNSYFIDFASNMGQMYTYAFTFMFFYVSKKIIDLMCLCFFYASTIYVVICEHPSQTSTPQLQNIYVC